jgi:hypothetical protein
MRALLAFSIGIGVFAFMHGSAQALQKEIFWYI